MKTRYLLVALLSLTFFSCDDNSGSLGLGMFPGSDQNINGQQTTFQVSTQSEIAKNVFAKTSVGYLGKFTDPDFGYYEAGFLTQFHCIDDFKFPALCDTTKEADRNNPNTIMISNSIDRIELLLQYTSYFGDSLTASRMSVYQLSNNLDKQAAYYTSINPAEFYNPSDLIGRKAYTAVDLADSTRSSSNYTPSITVTLPKELGQKIYEASRKAENDKVNFANIFKDMFKGIYVKSDYGDGTILYIDQIEMRIYFPGVIRNSEGAIIKKRVKQSDGSYVNLTQDSISYNFMRAFAATKEIIQANSFRSEENLIAQKAAEKEWTYLKTPAGIYTQATLPLKDFEDNLKKDTINVAKLTFTNYNQSNVNDKSPFSMNAPTYVLLVREKDRDSFFKENKINDNITSYLAKHNSTNQYIFNNLSQLVNSCLAEKQAAETELLTFGEIRELKDENGQPVKTIEDWQRVTQWDKVSIIPVTVSTDANNNIISVLNDLQPSYTKLKGGLEGSKLDLNVVYTSFEKN